MRREERRRKFHEAVVSMLYPPQPTPLQQEDEDKPVQSFREGVDLGFDSGDLEGNSCSTSDENGEGKIGEQKLSRAQRKRLRRKKLKEDASRRGNIIGPLLPPPTNDEEEDNGGLGNDPLGVRRNATEKPDTSFVTDNKTGELPIQSSKKKLKNRRMAKRLAKDQLNPSATQCCNQADNGSVP